MLRTAQQTPHNDHALRLGKFYLGQRKEFCQLIFQAAKVNVNIDPYPGVVGM